MADRGGIEVSNPFPFSDDNKRYHTLHYANLRRFGGRVEKAAIDTGLTCPNIDGTKGRGGCIFCASGSGYFTSSPQKSVEEQISAELARIRAKWPDARAVAYFQAHTNTYAPLARLRINFEAALWCEGICGLTVATRADCLAPDVLEYLAELAKRTDLTVELGLQSASDETARRINRCHDYRAFLEGYAALKARGVRVCVHLINGLPGEDEAQMLDTVKKIAPLRPDGVKIHLLHVIRGTALAEMLEMGQYRPMEREDYIRVVVRQLERLPETTVIERLTGDGDRRTLLAPLWSRDKLAVLGGIDSAMARADTWQGRLFAAAL